MRRWYWYNVVCFYNQSNSHPSLTRVSFVCVCVCLALTTSLRNGLGLYRCARARSNARVSVACSSSVFV